MHVAERGGGGGIAATGQHGILYHLDDNCISFIHSDIGVHVIVLGRGTEVA